MNDIRRTILWVIFGFSLVMLWDKWQVHNGHPATFFPTPTVAAAPAEGAASAPAGTGVPPAVATPASAAGAGQVPGAPASATAAAPAAQELVEVTTDVYKLSFDSAGGSLVRAELLKNADLTDPHRHLVLLDQSAERVYLAQTGLIGAPDLPNHTTPMQPVPGPRALADGTDRLEVQFESPVQGGVKLVKTYVLERGSYTIGVKHEVVNAGSTTVTPQLYMQLVRDGNKPPGESSFYFTFTGPAVYTEEGKFQKVDFKHIEENDAKFVKSASDGYVAMVQHYFASAWLLGDGTARDIFARKVGTNLYAIGMISTLAPLAPGATQAVESRLFVGPQIETMMERVYPGLERVKDYGWVHILAKPLYWLLEKLYAVIHNWGWSIVALVVLLKVAFYWLNAKAYASMAKMKAINPRITEMRERLKDKPQQMQQEMMKIYREEKINPLGGCLPIMIQIPVFIALYWVLLSSVEMRGAPWIGWIKDLSAPDPWYLLPVIMTLTTLLQTALNPAPPDPMQAKLMWIMPLAFSVMFFFFPSGLVLYWITNNILSIAQQWLINRRMGVPPQFNLPKFS
ncbi:membrane protein insertase YidC [Pseudorhodoferax sp.]|uniref:membrane protein insertase YidC n=1 Tax=Pseudorhodoferax sp. TaxID=1993553 RepID=UPI0039E30E28